MARIRTIKPEFPQSETVGKLSRDARLLFIQIWTIVDDYGRARAAPKLLAGQLYPYDDDAPKLMGKWLSELERGTFIRLYQVEGCQYLQVLDWEELQHRPYRSIKASLALRAIVYERDGPVCRYCGDGAGPFEIDHVVPVARGGDNDIGNLCVSCRPCNRSKGSLPLTEWLQ